MSEETRGTEAKRKGAGADVKGRALGFTLSGMGEPLRGSKQRGHVVCCRLTCFSGCCVVSGGGGGCHVSGREGGDLVFRCCCLGQELDLRAACGCLWN